MKKRFLSFAVLLLLLVSMVMPAAAGSDKRLVDEADLLSIEEENMLLSTLDEISQRQQMEIVVVTVNSLGGKTAQDYAFDYYDTHDYGYGPEKDGIILVVSMAEREWYMATTGYGITVFTDAGLDYLSDVFLDDLSQGEYFDAFIKYASICDMFVTQAKENEPYDIGHMPKGKVPVSRLLPCIIIGVFISWMIGLKQKAKLKSVRKNPYARDYVVPGSLVYTASSDRFTYRTMNTRRIKTSQSSSGGSTTRRGSSGRSHGGRGGRF